MLLNHQQRKILELLCKTEHVTASELAGQLGIGVKTVRVRIKELNPELEKKGIQILSKSRYGYYLDPRQPEGIEGLLNPKENEDPVIPSNNQERVHFLLAYLLNRTEYIKSEELCDFLHISSDTDRPFSPASRSHPSDAVFRFLPDYPALQRHPPYTDAD